MEIFSDIYAAESFFDTNIEIEVSLSGICSVSLVTSRVKSLLASKFNNKNPTFKDLYDLNGARLYICAVNVTKMKPVYFSVDNFPDMHIIDAINMSCNIPFIFKKIEFQGDYYVDGGLSVNVPLDIVYHNKLQYSLSSHYEDKVLCVVTAGTISIKNNFEHLPKIQNELDYLYKIIVIPVNSLTNFTTTAYSDVSSVSIMKMHLNNVPLITNSLTKPKKMEIFKQGYNFAKTEHETLELKIV
jgi:predicted patatin/cPLA2 family phospholipase